MKFLQIDNVIINLETIKKVVPNFVDGNHQISVDSQKVDISFKEFGELLNHPKVKKLDGFLNINDLKNETKL